MTERTVTVGVIDNDRFALQAMVGYLNKALPSAFDIIWAVESGRDGVLRCSDAHAGACPDIIVVDMSLGDIGGVEVMRRIRSRNARTAMLAVTSFPVGDYAADVARAGGQGIVGKNRVSDIAAALTAIAGHGMPTTYPGVRFDPPGDAFRRIARDGFDGVGALSNQETAVVERCAQGDTSAQIAERMGMGVTTVNTYLQRAMTKLGARNRTHLVALWLKSNDGRR
ncbi:response regulator transcription factor [Bifidobacterium samirii]|uniref:DNA-binding response regulator n=1 Tax=Bifidobacterium samirii TaxID=2306974 RepID=A0A430FWU4_9BIFI|nr:response regulator transcription factor [Bifidobacterium samirii]RSX58749.1 DNA-binding response regulator [Bifidobacterium samirii]